MAAAAENEKYHSSSVVKKRHRNLPYKGGLYIQTSAILSWPSAHTPIHLWINGHPTISGCATDNPAPSKPTYGRAGRITPGERRCF